MPLFNHQWIAFFLVHNMLLQLFVRTVVALHKTGLLWYCRVIVPQRKMKRTWLLPPFNLLWSLPNPHFYWWFPNVHYYYKPPKNIFIASSYFPVIFQLDLVKRPTIVCSPIARIWRRFIRIASLSSEKKIELNQWEKGRKCIFCGSNLWPQTNISAMLLPLFS